MRAFENATKGSAIRFSCTPVIKAASIPKPSFWQAMSKATKEDEQAVSTDALAPLSPRL